MLGRVEVHVSGRVTGVRQAAAAVALIKDDDPEPRRVKQSPGSCRASRPRPPVHDQGRRTVGIPAGLPVDEVPVPGIQEACLVRLDVRVPRHATSLLAVQCAKAACTKPGMLSGSSAPNRPLALSAEKAWGA